VHNIGVTSRPVSHAVEGREDGVRLGTKNPWLPTTKDSQWVQKLRTVRSKGKFTSGVLWKVRERLLVVMREKVSYLK